MRQPLRGLRVPVVAALICVSPFSLRSESGAESSQPSAPVLADRSSVDDLASTIAQRAADLNLRLQGLERERQALERETKELETLRARLSAIAAGLPAKQPLVASLAAPALPEPAMLPVIPQKTDRTTAAPLFFRIGAAEFTPGGFLEFDSAFRSRNLGSGIGTSFGSIPFANTPAGQLTESRFGAQASRLSLKIGSHPGGATDLTGYVEADFLGTQPTSGYVTSNSNTLRMRLYWADVRHGKWEILGGQSWSLLTPNRNGVSPAPADIFLPMTVDPNYMVGLNWTRAPQVRFAYHASRNIAAGISLENPEQYVGTSVALPSSFPATQVDNGSNLTTPGLHPDLVTKVALDGKLAGRGVHAEVAGLYRSFRVVNQFDNQRFTQPAGGGSVNFNFEAVKNLRLIVNTFYGSGGGRYLGGLGPDLIVRPDYTLSNVRSGSTLSGFEYQVTPGWLVYSYYGLAYFERNTAWAGKSLIGFGGQGMSAANRSIHEPSVGITRIFWKKPEIGAFQVGLQYAYLRRNLWWAAPGSPASANMNMVMTNIRYVLP